MLENQFIKFNVYKNTSAISTPVVVSNLKDIGIFIAPPSGKKIDSVAVMGEDNSVILSQNIQESQGIDDILHLSLFGQNSYLDYASYYIRFKQRFYIRFACSDSLGSNVSYLWSVPLVCIEDDYISSGFAAIEYKCDEDAFGFPFASAIGNPTYHSAVFYMPIRMHSPQNVQDDKTYVKANGEVVTLYAKYYREWECETEYLSADTHDKIVAALSCDEVYINGKRVTKSDKYQVDWENYDLDCDGATKLAKATFKVREHITQRNSNY